MTAPEKPAAAEVVYPAEPIGERWMPVPETEPEPAAAPLSPRHYETIAGHVFRARSEPPARYFPTVAHPTAPTWTLRTFPRDEDGIVVVRVIELPEIEARDCDGDRAQREAMALVLDWYIATAYAGLRAKGGTVAVLGAAAAHVAELRARVRATRQDPAAPPEVLAMFRAYVEPPAEPETPRGRIARCTLTLAVDRIRARRIDAGEAEEIPAADLTALEAGIVIEIGALGSSEIRELAKLGDAQIGVLVLSGLDWSDPAAS